MFAIGGCNMPSTASMEGSRTKAELTAKKVKLERAIPRVLRAHGERGSFFYRLVIRPRGRCSFS